MSGAMYIAVEGGESGFDTFVNGKALSKANEVLEEMAENLGVTPLMKFFSLDDESRAFLEEEGGIGANEDQQSSPTQWFSADEGLTTASTLLDCIAKNAAKLDDPAGVTKDLREFVSILQKIKERGLRWHLAIDF
jgi:hypothetical protein